MNDETDQEEVPPPDESAIPAWASDNKASKEVNNWGDDAALKGQLNKNDLLHLKIYGFVVAGGMVIFSVLYIVSLCIWVFHYIMPERFGFLVPEQLQKIQSILFSGSLGAVVSSVMTKRMSK
jgi:hypothetical protein